MGQFPQTREQDFAPGTILCEKYEIEERIGSGGMGTVYRARHLIFNELRALKIVNAVLMSEQYFVERFRAEAVISRKLQHPNAVRVKDIDTTKDGRPFIVMEFVAGCSLRSRLHEKRLDIDHAISICCQMCAALGAAHEIGIVHRDIKPENVLVQDAEGPEPKIKILDFGIARAREASGQLGPTTRTGLVMGTPQYMSPEQALGRHGDQIDERSDLYSVGLVLYEMLTGVSPFRADTPLALLNEQILAIPTSPQQIRPDVPGWLVAVVMKSLEKNPERRFQTACEMNAALQPTVASTVLRPNAPWTERDPKSGRHTLGLFALIILALVVIGFIYLQFVRANPGAADWNPPPAGDVHSSASHGEQAGSPELIRVVPPDKGDIFDWVYGCQEADRLVALCKEKKIKISDESFASLGGYQEPLPELTKVPKGYKLEANPLDCDTATQWQHYCQMNPKR